MSKELSRSLALTDISAWDTEEVLQLLRKNGLEECCKAVTKRQIDGDELLHLTDGKLALWKNDLTRPLIGKLWTFVQELNSTPEKYSSSKIVIAEQNDDHSHDSDSWGTDFEDEMSEESSHIESTQKETVKPSLIKGRQTSQQNNNMQEPSLKKNVARPQEEETYANFETCQDDEEDNMYENFQEMKPPPTKNISRLHDLAQKMVFSAATENAKESKHKSELLTKKPIIGPKPEALLSRKVVCPDRESLQKSFLYNRHKINQCVIKEMQRRMATSSPPEPKKNKDYTSVETKKSEKELPKPPATIRNFDLVANLPAQTEESEDEYETLGDDTIEQPQRIDIPRVDSKLSLHSGRQGSVESVYKPLSSTSYEEDDEEFEIYECITEMPEENDYLSPIKKSNMQIPPPLPAKPALTPSPTPPNQRIKSEKITERSPEKKSATLPHSGSNVSLSNERATRPLPPPPERQSHYDKPWFHNVTREQATALIGEQGTYNNPQNGYFLLRPSTTNISNPLALVLWYRDRVYNIPVRKRIDNRYALGFAKTRERSFSTVEEIVLFYMKEELDLLHTGGTQAGSTKLTDTPPK